MATSRPSQADYNQAVHGGGHGDYHNIVLAPASVQEAIDLTVLSFDLAEKYRTICMVILDGCVGQMMEPAKMPEMRPIAARELGLGHRRPHGKARAPHPDFHLSGSH